MKRISVILVAGLIALLPATVMGDEAKYEESRKRYLQTAEEYQGKALELRAMDGDFSGAQQKLIGQLTDVYSDLAEIKTALADAIGERNREREEKLEKKYYALKDREGRLWDDLERSKG